MKVLIDSHVHFHPCFNWTRFLDAAGAHFRNGRHELKLPPTSPGCLAFTEAGERNAFCELRDDASIAGNAGWMREESHDSNFVVLARHGNERMLIVAGRQLVSAENLELLALGCTQEFERDVPLERLIMEVCQAGAAAVIPWGFGKWWGRRGVVLRSLLAHRPPVPFSLGDNGGRPRGWFRPRLLVEAERAGVAILPGSDPLPLRSHERRAGSYGFAIDTGQDQLPDRSALIRSINALRASPPSFGRTSGMGSAIQSQLQLRLPIGPVAARGPARQTP